MNDPNTIPNPENADMQCYMPVEPIKKAPAFTLFETVGGWLSLVFGFIFTHFVCGYACGIWGGIFWAAAGAAGAVYTRAKRINASAAQRAVFVIAEAFCLVPVLYSNYLINFLAATFSFVLLFYLAVTISGAELFGKHFVIDALKGIFVRPFISFSAAPRAAFSLFRGGKRAKSLLFVLLGLLAALPVTLVVVNLLISSDKMFESMMNDISAMLPKLSGSLVAEIIFAVPAGFILFGAAFSMNKPAAEYRSAAPDYRVIPPALSYAAATPLCAFYLLYFFSQFGYFTSAFGGTLPDGFSVAEYARRGFFELCAVAVINLFVIMMIQAFTRRGENDRRPAALRVYTVVLSGFSLLFIACSVSKMLMYISRLGMTKDRIYTTWFMVVLAVTFVMVIVWQFRDIKFWRSMFIAFTVLFAVLCFGNVDGMIARLNISAYENGTLAELDVSMLKYDIGTPAVAPAAEYLARGEIDAYTLGRLEDFLTSAAEELAEPAPEYFSIQRAIAQNALKNAGFTAQK